MQPTLFEEPFVLRNDENDAIVLRQREWDSVDRQRWTSKHMIVMGTKLFRCTS